MTSKSTGDDALSTLGSGGRGDSDRARPFTAGDCGREGDLTGGVNEAPVSKSMFVGSGDGLITGNALSMSGDSTVDVGAMVDVRDGAARLNMCAKREVEAGGGEDIVSAR